MKLQLDLVIASLMILTYVNAAHSETDSTTGAYLSEHSQAPVDYVMSKATSHRITLIGEAHWLQQDVTLVAALVPLFQKAGIDLATEIFPASEQPRIDELITAPKWNEQGANAVMRAASWPYREYRDLLRTVWSANQNAQSRITILALGPPPDCHDHTHKRICSRRCGHGSGRSQ